MAREAAPKSATRAARHRRRVGPVLLTPPAGGLYPEDLGSIHGEVGCHEVPVAYLLLLCLADLSADDEDIVVPAHRPWRTQLQKALGLLKRFSFITTGRT